MSAEYSITQGTEVRGVGLHSGAPVALRLLPAPGGTGIEFRRTDLEGFVVEARSINIARVSYATSLMKKSVLISTTEHLLAALVGCGIDNVVAELDNLEVPILDGSARPFVEMIDRAVPKPQRKKRNRMRILEPIELEESGKFIGIYPGSGYRVRYDIDFPHPVIGRQSFEIDLTPESFRRELAPARTFGFLRDVPLMKKQGLIRGGSSENAVVLDDTRVVNGELRFRDEFVRHKTLDLIGDLALLGSSIVGHVYANRAGHAMHTALVKRLARDRHLWQAVSEPEFEPVLAR